MNEQSRPKQTIDQAMERQDRLLLAGLMLPMMMAIVNMSMFSVALPTIRNTFSLQADVTAWVVTAFTLPYVIFMPIYGRLADELGKRRLFLTGLTVFLF